MFLKTMFHLDDKFCTIAHGKQTSKPSNCLSCLQHLYDFFIRNDKFYHWKLKEKILWTYTILCDSKLIQSYSNSEFIDREINQNVRNIELFSYAICQVQYLMQEFLCRQEKYHE